MSCNGTSHSNPSSSAAATGSGGIGFFGLLTLVFIVLKLCHIINWSWFYVLMPLWCPAAVGLSLVVLILGFTIVVHILDRKK